MFLKLAFAFVMHCLMLHCFRFVFPTLGNYMYNRYKIENKLSLSTIKSRIKFHETENKRFTQKWFLDNFTQTYSQGLQILLMGGVSVTSASQILESFWNIWSQVSQRKKPNRLSSTWSWHVYTIVRDTRSSCAVRWPGKLKSMMAVIE